MKLRISNTEGEVYNPVRRSFIRPKVFEELCPVCKGKGTHKSKGNKKRPGFDLCTRCLGKGTIDWIGKVMKQEVKK